MLMPVYQYFWCRTLKTVQSLHQMEVNSLVHHWNIAGRYLIKTLLCFKTLQGRNILVNLGFELIFKTWKILMGKKILLENTLVVVLGCFLHDYFLRCKRSWQVLQLQYLYGVMAWITCSHSGGIWYQRVNNEWLIMSLRWYLNQIFS